MFIEKEYLDRWFQKIMERFDRLENSLVKPLPERERQMLDGELLLDNQDLCIMLNVSKRSLQRYRSLGWLPFKQIDQKMYYLKSEVETFIKEHFEKRYKSKK
ncbi:MAG: helix-turn-helix domain-containing protein [Dysgonamonadaceae bacterium]|jgi:hypothetical protein|nr:helix-turn-helix domain-containing protein [Dysgonamonadaceae bacterium]